MPSNISSALDYGTSCLAGIERPRLHAELLLAFLLQKDRVELHLRGDDIISDETFLEYKAYIERLKNHEPLEYITQKVSFYGYEWKIIQGVLIPRPETEILVDLASTLIKKKGIKKVFEFGVGSGIISITLALLNPHIEVIASDINPLAIGLSKENLEYFSKQDLTLKDRVNFVECDVLHSQDIFFHHTFDLLISNPPYIALSYELPCNVAYEPQNALFGGENGDEILKELIQIANQYKIPHIACEMGFDQKEAMHTALLGFEMIEFFQDFSGFNRGFIASKSKT